MQTKPMGSLATVSIDIETLTDLAVNGLVPMFDHSKQMFCARAVRTADGLAYIDHSPRYTIMTLLGLREREKSGQKTPFNTENVFQTFVRDTSWIQGVGDSGLLIWLFAEYAPSKLTNLLQQLELNTLLSRFQDGRRRSTTELAWLLAGLSHAAATSPAVVDQVKGLALETFRLVGENQGPYGYFGHLAANRSIAGRIRGRIGSFADQIYPVYSFSKFTEVYGGREAIEKARKCATAICEVQGKLGQWWWLYDSVTGQVSSRYPVYSVHQHAMAPMGLFALEKAAGLDFQENILRGLRWIYGENELCVDMRDLQHNFVWRCIRPRNKNTKYWETATGFFRKPVLDAPVGQLEVLHEDWPYELGWLLYAFSRNSLRHNQL